MAKRDPIYSESRQAFADDAPFDLVFNLAAETKFGCPDEARGHATPRRGPARRGLRACTPCGQACSMHSRPAVHAPRGLVYATCTAVRCAPTGSAPCAVRASHGAPSRRSVHARAAPLQLEGSRRTPHMILQQYQSGIVDLGCKCAASALAVLTPSHPPPPSPPPHTHSCRNKDPWEALQCLRRKEAP